MRISEEKLKETLEGLYSYYFKVSKTAASRPEGDDLTYEEIKSLGAVDVIGAVYLQCFGGEAMTKLWLENAEK